MSDDPLDDPIMNYSHDGRPLYYDKQGQPMTMRQWAERAGDFDYKVVAKTQYGDVEVSTVWLGLDHSLHWGKDGRPVIFETMVFGDTSEYADQQWRYSTEEQARAGHAEICSMVFARVPLTTFDL